jgi:NAD(P)-dependent dehydrogenase (short-subunit alcohol dehydrogenase family)
MGKLDGKIAVITAATSGMALETAKLLFRRELTSSSQAVSRTSSMRPCASSGAM